MENLGKLGPWQIRDFPEVLRRQITDAARIEGVGVGEFVTRCMVMLRDAGWPKSADGLSTTSTEVALTGRRGADLGELKVLVEMATSLTTPPGAKDTGVLREARRAVSAKLKQV